VRALLAEWLQAEASIFSVGQRAAEPEVARGVGAHGCGEAPGEEVGRWPALALQAAEDAGAEGGEAGEDRGGVARETQQEGGAAGGKEGGLSGLLRDAPEVFGEAGCG
jgi:hypothetical protein